MANVAFLGLGVMGFPMAGHLHKAGHNVTVYNRTASKSKNGSTNMAALPLRHLDKQLKAQIL